MKSKEPKKEFGTEPIRLKSSVVNLVRDNKQKTGIPIGRFIEDAIQEKLKRDAKES